ncbi:MAG: hypothetical protein ACTSQY_11660 [Candidatus Odinarchaeia archaeon]
MERKKESEKEELEIHSSRKLQLRLILIILGIALLIFGLLLPLTSPRTYHKFEEISMFTRYQTDYGSNNTGAPFYGFMIVLDSPGSVLSQNEELIVTVDIHDVKLLKYSPGVNTTDPDTNETYVNTTVITTGEVFFNIQLLLFQNITDQGSVIETRIIRNVIKEAWETSSTGFRVYTFNNDSFGVFVSCYNDTYNNITDFSFADYRVDVYYHTISYDYIIHFIKAGSVSGGLIMVIENSVILIYNHYYKKEK